MELLRVICNLIIYIISIARPYGNQFKAVDKDIMSADAVLVQAFGRRNYKDKELVEILKKLFCKTENVVERFDFLKSNGFEPGTSNLYLAQECLDLLHSNSNLVLVIQWEVGFALWKISPYTVGELRQNNRFFCLWPSNEYYSTWDVKTDSVNICNSYGFIKLLELAHPAMIMRALMILWKLGTSPKLIISEVPFDKQSIQKWTRGLEYWIGREFLNRIRESLIGHISLLPPN